MLFCISSPLIWAPSLGAQTSIPASESLWIRHWEVLLRLRKTSSTGDNPKLCYMDTDSLMVHAESKDIYEDLHEDVETRFDTSNYKSRHLYP